MAGPSVSTMPSRVTPTAAVASAAAVVVVAVAVVVSATVVAVASAGVAVAAAVVASVTVVVAAVVDVVADVAGLAGAVVAAASRARRPLSKWRDTAAHEGSLRGHFIVASEGLLVVGFEILHSYRGSWALRDSFCAEAAIHLRA